MKLKLIIKSKTMPTHCAGTSLKTGKPKLYDFVSCWGETLDEKRLSHGIILDPTEWNAFVADGYRERDCLIVETTGEGKPRTDADGKPFVRKAANGTEYVVMDYPAKADENSTPKQKLRGLPLKLAKDLPMGRQNPTNPVTPAPKAPETPEDAVKNDGTTEAPKDAEEPKAPETAMTDVGSVAPM